MPVEINIENDRGTVGGGEILHALFSTISYNLEPDGWGTRFPILFKHVYLGRLYPNDAGAALAELRTIRIELMNIPISKAVWVYESHIDGIPQVYKYNRYAKSLAEFFLTGAGRDFLCEIADSLEAIVEFPQCAHNLPYKFPLDFIAE